MVKKVWILINFKKLKKKIKSEFRNNKFNSNN